MQAIWAPSFKSEQAIVDYAMVIMHIKKEYHAQMSPMVIRSFDLVSSLQYMYAQPAQYNLPPHYPVTVICKGIDEAAFGKYTLSKIYGGMVAYQGLRDIWVLGATLFSPIA